MTEIDVPKTRARSSRIAVKKTNFEESNKENDCAELKENGKKYSIPEGLSKMQKKNMRKALRNREKKAEQKQEEQSKSTDGMNDSKQDERLILFEQISKQLAGLPSLACVPAAKFNSMFDEQELFLNELFQSVSEVVDGCKKVKKKNLSFTSQQITDQLKSLLSEPEVDQEALAYLQEQLQEVLLFENARKFLPLFTKLMEDLEIRRSVNHKLKETVQQRNMFHEIVKQIEDMKDFQGGKGSIKVTQSNVLSQEFDIPNEAWSVIGSGINSIRKLEKMHSVVLKRTPNRQKTLTVYGLESDIRAFIEFILTSNFSTPCQIQLDSHVMPSFVGTSGNVLKQLEQTLRCLLVTKNNNTVFIYGPKNNTDKAKEYIKTSYMNDAANQYQASREIFVTPIIKKALLTSNYQNILRSIEAENSVTIRIEHARDPAFKPNAEQNKTNNLKQKKEVSKLEDKILVRGKVADADNAKKTIEKFVSSLHVIDFEVDTVDTLHRLFGKTVVSRNNQQQSTGVSGPQTRSRISGKEQKNDILLNKKLTPNQSAAEEFSSLIRLNDTVAFLRNTPTSLSLVGSENELSQLKPKIESLIASSSIVPSNVTIPNELSFLFTPERIAAIEFNSKCILIRRFRRNSNHIFFEVHGNDEQKLVAENEFQEIMDNQGYCENLSLDENVVKHLFKSQRKALLDLEFEFGVHILIDRSTFECRVLGSKENVAAAIQKLSELGNKLNDLKANLHVINVQLPSRGVIRSIIGSKGAVINEILEKSGVNSIKIDDKTLSVKITGLGLSCSVAEKLLNTIIEKRSKENNSNNYDMKMAEAKKTDLETGKTASEASVFVAPTSFPTLNEAAGLKAPKRPVTRRKKAAETGLRV